MSKNPFVNALVATAYISAIASFMYYGPKESGPIDGVIIPIAFLSLFVLSAAVMGYCFLYMPARLLFENKAPEATKLFLSTLAVFACITIALVLSWIFLARLFN